MTALTPDEVAKLRLPEGFRFIQPPRGWTVHQLELEVTTADCAIADIAQRVARGHLPPAVLDAVWATVEGKKSDIEIVLGYQGGSIEVHKSKPGSNNWIRIYPDGKAWTTFSGVDFAKVVVEAREWIERQG